jgi:hypothetical protein|tara:strand:+ start:407 stop:949 length:543 start_codon:yes stop_codon:yes gene_type:complete
MAEPFARPTNQQVEKMREFIGDPYGFFLMNVAIKTMNEIKFPKEDNSYLIAKEWIRQSRLMFNNFPAIFVHEKLYEVYSDLSNKVWENRDYSEVWSEEQKEISIDPAATEIKDKIKITDIAKKYGLDVKGSMAICPFHDDKDPSLSLSNSKGVFHCFGCNVKGDIITFYRMLKEVKNEKK